MNERCCHVENEAALSLFIRQERPKLIRLLLTLVDRSRAEDVFQEAIFKVFQLAEANPSSQSFYNKLQDLTPMLFAIAKNKAISEIRHIQIEARYRNDDISASSGTSLEASVINDHQSQQLLEAINQLPPICRQVFVQRKLNGKSHAQIAQLLGISTKTVETHITRGLKLCRQYLRTQQTVSLQCKKRNVGSP